MPSTKAIKANLFRIIFGTSTKAGKLFDVILLWVILASAFVVMMESTPGLVAKYSKWFFVLEWFFTVIFTLEYIARVWSSPKPWKYIFSFWGFIDFCSTLPTYLELLLSGSHYLIVVRIIRLIRVFRVFKLVRFVKESHMLLRALKSSYYKVSVFLMLVVSIVILLGTLMYVVEGEARGFTSIPQGVYWAIVTVTTVGYGDIVPQTVIGKIVSSIAMIMGYAIIAVPTGIISAELSRPNDKAASCKNCLTALPTRANYCPQCGSSTEMSPSS